MPENRTILWIDGSEMPTPTEIKYGEYVLSKAERNLLGNMAFAYINKKIRIDVRYAVLSEAQLKFLKRALYYTNAGGKGIHQVTVIFPSMAGPDDQSVVTSFRGYVGDLEYSTLIIKDNKMYYKDVTFQLVQL